MVSFTSLMAASRWSGDPSNLVTRACMSILPFFVTREAYARGVPDRLTTPLSDPELVQRTMKVRRVAIQDRKSTRLNSSHVRISYAVFCLKKKKPTHPTRQPSYPTSDRNRQSASLNTSRFGPQQNLKTYTMSVTLTKFSNSTMYSKSRAG